MSHKPPGAAVPDHRRKWDASEYELLAQERRDARRAAEEEASSSTAKRPKREYDDEGKLKPMREDLKARDFKVDLDGKVGKSVVINKQTPSNETGGYYCDVCDCVVKDSMTFLDHINGKSHQKNMGMSMKIKRSTLEDVKARMAMKRGEKDKKKKEYDFQERLDDLKQEEIKIAEYRKEKRKAAKERKRPSHEEPLDDNFQAMMGFGGFGTTKSN